jgi:hypothetical protein
LGSALFEGVKMLQASLKEIESLGATTIVDELSELRNKMAKLLLTPPELLTSMASDVQTFYKNNQSNPWLLSQVKSTSSHASH